MYPYVFTEPASADIIEHAMLYESKSEGLGTRFMDEVNNAAEDISKLPKGYVNRYKNTRERKSEVSSELLNLRSNKKNRYTASRCSRTAER